MTLIVHVLTTTAAPDGSRLCLLQEAGTYRVAHVAADGTLTRLPHPPTADLEEAYTHLITAVRARARRPTHEGDMP
jgi:hypothetical protein